MTDSKPSSCTVFISYSSEQKDWVCEQLKPYLKEAGIKVLIDRDDFTAGRTTEINIASAVNEADHTVAVVTEDWVASLWVELEKNLQLEKDRDGVASRLIPLVFVPHGDLPDEVSRLTYFDFSTTELRAAGMSKLLSQLDVTQQKIDATNALFFKKGLCELRVMMRSGKVKEIVGDIGSKLKNLRNDLKRPEHLKNLHDNFQSAEAEFRHVYNQWTSMREKSRPSSTVDECDWDKLELLYEKMLDKIECLLKIATQFLKRGKLTWTKKLEYARDGIAEAIFSRDIAKLSSPIGQLRDTFKQAPFQLNILLVGAAENLDLWSVVERLRTLDDQLDSVEFEAEVVASFVGFRNGIMALCGLDASLNMLLEQHNHLQGLIQELGGINFLEGIENLSFDNILALWPPLKLIVIDLSHETGRAKPGWLEKIESTGEDLSEWCACKDVDEKELKRNVRRSFYAFYGRVDNGLNRVDFDLKELFAQLEDVGSELDEMLGGMKDG